MNNLTRVERAEITTQGIWWQNSEYKKVISSVTGRPLYVNTSEARFLVPPTFSPEKARAASECASQFWKKLTGPSRPAPKLRPYLSAFNAVSSLKEFCDALDDLFENGRHVKSNVTRGRITDLLIALWQADCLAAPRNKSSLIGQLHEDRHYWGNTDHRLLNIIREFKRVSSGKCKHDQLRILSTTTLCIIGVAEIGDLTPQVLDGMLALITLAPSITTALVAMMKVSYGPEKIGFNFDDYGPFGKRAERNKNQFNWAVHEDESLEAWRSLAQEWMCLQVRKIPDRRSAINAFLNVLISDRNLPRDPLVFLSTSTTISSNFISSFKHRQSIGNVAEFLEWILSTRCTAEDDHGHPYRIPGYRNPVDRNLLPSVRHAESVREAMPTRFVRRLRDIIVEDDYAWPRAAFERGADNVRWYNPETSEWEDIWSPVRALAVLIKLELPERTFQVRVCNSGEADEERYDPASNTWQRNDHPLAGQTPYGKPMGLPRQIKDFRVNNTFTGLYFNTNKTGDLGKTSSERGHVIPWQNERVLQLGDQMRRWQEKYNPVHRPTAWIEIEEMRSRYAEEVLIERGAETFLFRDPCAANPDQPVSHTRLSLFWKKLCAELQRRLAEEGEVGPGGAVIELTTKGSNGRDTGTVYDLHSLRVTMITAWAEAGVPIEILMKVAGHATAIMTIYYQKHSIAHVTQVLDNACAEMMLNEQGNWQAWLKSKSYDELTPLVAHTDPSGPRAFFESSTASVVRRDHGICPVGCGRCHEGGPKVEGSGTIKYHAVPGGAQNCVRCRFFITGPCFLLGLSSYFDDIGFRYREASRKYAATGKDFERLDHERRQAVAAGIPFAKYSEFERVSSNLDQRTREVDEIALTWHATYNLIQQSLGILRNRSANKEDESKNALILVGSEEDLDFALELDEAGDLEFELLDKICQTSVFFKSIDATVPNLKRMRRFDSLLLRSGHDAVFVHITEEDSIAAGNEFARFLYTRFGRETTNELMNGKRTLASLGLDGEQGVSEQLSALGTHRRPIGGPTIHRLEAASG